MTKLKDKMAKFEDNMANFEVLQLMNKIKSVNLNFLFQLFKKFKPFLK